jgi:hypothetical protein
VVLFDWVYRFDLAGIAKDRLLRFLIECAILVKFENAIGLTDYILMRWRSVGCSNLVSSFIICLTFAAVDAPEMGRCPPFKFVVEHH